MEKGELNRETDVELGWLPRTPPVRVWTWGDDSLFLWHSLKDWQRCAVSYAAGGNVNRNDHFGKLAVSTNSRYRYAHDLAIPLLGVYPTETWILLTRTLLTEGWINDLYTREKENYRAMRLSTLRLQATVNEVHDRDIEWKKLDTTCTLKHRDN